MADKNLETKVTIDSDVDGLKKISATSGGAEKSVKQLGQAVAAAGNELREAGADVDKLSKDIKELDAAAAAANQEIKTTGRASSQAGSDLQILERRIQEAGSNWKALNAATIAAKTEYIKMKAAVATTGEEFQAQSKKIKAAEQAEMAAITATRLLVQEHAKLSGSTEKTGAAYQNLSLDLQSAEGHINGVTNKAKMQERSMQNLSNSVDGVGEKVQGLGGILSRMVDAANNKLSEMKIGLWNKAFDMAGDAAMQALRAVVDFVNESNQQFQDFDQNVRQVFTMIPGQSEAMKQSVSADLREMGVEIGRVSDEYLPAMYQALSLGIPKDNSLDAVATASNAARAANAELTPTLVTGQSIVNAYGGELYDLNRVYDLLFFAVKNGAVTIEELNSGMSEITSVAGEANVPLEDIVSAIIVMTKQGDSFSAAAGLMSNMLTQLSISGTAMGSAFKEAAGKDFRTFIAEGGNLAQALKLIEDHVKSTGGTMTETLGGDSNFYRDQQAMRGALELTGKHMDEFLSLSLQAVDAQGLVAEASAEVADSMAMTAAQTEAATEALQIQIGQALAPSRRAWMEYKMELASGWGNIFAALNGDYAASIQAMIETNVAAATSQEDLIAISEDVAVALNKASEWDISNSREALIQELQDLVFSLIEVNETAVTSREKFDAIDAALRAVYGDAITYEKGIFMLNGATIGYTTTLYDQAVAHQEAERAAAAQAEIEAELNRVLGEAASADAVMTRNAGLWNGVEAATQLAGLLAVLDGDTIRVDLGGEIQDVRFKNVNAPEIAHGEDAAMPWAYEAMNATQAYFDENPVEMGATLDRESYDRIIADFPDLERKLVREGLAIPLPVHMTEDPELFAELEQLAKDAAAAGEGMFEDQALAARILNGEMVDLGVYYEELAAHQGRVNEAFRDAAGPVGDYYDAIAAVTDVPAWNTTGIQEAKDVVLAANEEIIASHKRVAYETYLAQNGVTEGTIAMGVAMGIFSEAEGKKRLAFANTQTAIEELITNQDNLKLSDEQLIEATGLLISGMESTPEAAANAVKGLGGLETSAENARGAVKRAHDALIAAEGNYYATFTTENTVINKTYNKTYNEEVPGDKPEPKATGGRLSAGTPYLVGDDPNGGLTPYSELFVPDTSGYLLNASSTAALLAGNSGSTAVETTAVKSGDTYQITIVIEGDRNDLAHVAEAAEMGISRAMNALEVARATGKK